MLYANTASIYTWTPNIAPKMPEAASDERSGAETRNSTFGGTQDLMPSNKTLDR